MDNKELLEKLSEQIESLKPSTEAKILNWSAKVIIPLLLGLLTWVAAKKGNELAEAQKQLNHDQQIRLEKEFRQELDLKYIDLFYEDMKNEKTQRSAMDLLYLMNPELALKLAQGNWPNLSKENRQILRHIASDIEEIIKNPGSARKKTRLEIEDSIPKSDEHLEEYSRDSIKHTGNWNEIERSSFYNSIFDEYDQYQYTNEGEWMFDKFSSENFLPWYYEDQLRTFLISTKGMRWQDAYDYGCVSELIPFITDGISFFKNEGANHCEDPSGFPKFEFGQVNPEIVVWANDNLVPDPNDKILGSTYQDVYNNSYRSIVRVMASSYLFMSRNSLEYEAQKYHEISSTGDHILPYLRGRYTTSLSEFDHGWENPRKGEGFTIDEMCGFWCRRKLDGTSDELWKLLQSILISFDKSWYDRYV